MKHPEDFCNFTDYFFVTRILQKHILMWQRAETGRLLLIAHTWGEV